jgi:hypothetical protein
MRNPTGSKARTARPVARTIFTGVFISPQNGSKRARSSAEGRAERIPRPEMTRRIAESARGKNPGPGSWSRPMGIREEATTPYRASTNIVPKPTRSVFMLIARSSQGSYRILFAEVIRRGRPSAGTSDALQPRYPSFRMWRFSSVKLRSFPAASNDMPSRWKPRSSGCVIARKVVATPPQPQYTRAMIEVANP